MTSKCLCVLAIDASGSMLEGPNAGKIRINFALKEFVKNLKQDKDISSKLEICVIEIKEIAKVIIPPTAITKVDIPEFETTPTTNEKIRYGIFKALKQVKSWRRSNLISELLEMNYKPYIVLITDLVYSDLIKEEQLLPFKEKIKEATTKGFIKFYGIGIGKSQLVKFFDIENSNLYVTDKPDFNTFFNHLKTDLSVDLQKKYPSIEELTVAFLVKRVRMYIQALKKNLNRLTILTIIIIFASLCNRKIRSKGLSIKIDKIIEINNTEIKNYENIYPDNHIDIKIEPDNHWTEDDVKFVYEFEYNIDDYELGAYMHNSSEEVALSTEILLRNLYNLEQNFNINGDVYIKITGETDAVPINNVIYRGEFGTIYGEKFFINGEWFKMNLKEYEKLKTNTQLAFLRGYSIWDIMRRNCEFVVSQSTQYQQEVKINDNSNKIGGIYRRVKVEMILNDVKNIRRAKVERYQFD